MSIVNITIRQGNKINTVVSSPVRKANVNVGSLGPKVNATVGALTKKTNLTVKYGIKGDPGTPWATSIVDLPLPVSGNGQTQFNIFSLPTGNHLLTVNGIEHYLSDSYTISQSGGNTYLNWLGEYPLSTTDKLVFRKY